MDNLCWLDQIQPAHRDLVGDTAFYLGLLMQRGYPIAPGFIVSAAVFREFLQTIDWLEPLFADLPNSSLHLDVNDSRQLQAIAQRIRQAIQATTLPDRWAVEIEAAVRTWQVPTLMLRPSLGLQPGLDPTVSSRATELLDAQICWAEQTTGEGVSQITQSLKRVWAELFRARSLLYWQRLGIQLQQINLAVLVQPLRSAIAAGDLQIENTSLKIRATWGLGKALANGEAVPDSYQIQLQSGLVQVQHLGSKAYAYQVATASDVPSSHPASVLLPQIHDCLRFYPVEPARQTRYALTEPQLRQLIQLAQRVTTDLGTPLSLEWTCESSDTTDPALYLTQANPLLSASAIDEESQESLFEAPLKPQDVGMGETLTVAAHAAGLIATEGDGDSHVISQQAVQAMSPHMAGHQSERSLLRLTGLAAARGQVAAKAWVVTDVNQHLQDVPPGVVLVVPSITPYWLFGMRQAVAIVTEQGGMTSHGAIVAREIGIPAVVGVANITQRLQTGDLVWVDGDRGEIYQIEDEAALVEFAKANDSSRLNVGHQAKPAPLLSTLDRPNATRLLVNLSQLDSIQQVKDLPVDGVGLLRSELMLVEALEQQHPSLWLQQGRQADLVDRIATQICQFACAFMPRPVFYRSLDLRSHEYQSPSEAGFQRSEPNPILGLHGTLSYQVNPALFETELAALRQVQQSGYENVHLLLPFVRTVEEFAFCRDRVLAAGLKQNAHFQLWIMAEVPSVLFLLPDYVKAGVEGISIGSNDLTQLLLGVDRDQRQMAEVFDQRHPAVLRAIHQLIKSARQADIPCSICGQALSQHPELIESLVRWGITSISVSPDAVEQAYQAIARAEQGLLVEAARYLLADPDWG